MTISIKKITSHVLEIGVTIPSGRSKSHIALNDIQLHLHLLLKQSIFLFGSHVQFVLFRGGMLAVMRYEPW